MDRRHSLAVGVLVAALGVAAATGVVYGLKELAPVISLGVVWLPVVLLVSVYWGIGLGLATAVASAGAFNLFHLPPTGRLAVASAENWVALVAFLVVAAASSAVAELARSRAAEAEDRREEADLAAETARLLLGEERLGDGLATTAHLLARALDLPSAAIERGEVAPEGRLALPLRDGAGVVGTLVLPSPLRPAVLRRVQERIVPSLAALLGAALRREQLEAEVVETAALRRSDELKTALLRAVSHDLRSPLTGILTAGTALGSPVLQPGEREELSQGLVADAQRLSRLIDKLLDLSRIQAGSAPPREDAVDVGEVLVAARDALADGSSVHLQVDRDLPLVRADAVQLERAFANLMENAVRYGAGRPVSVRARAVGRRLVVRVVDQGPGVPAAEQARIFEPFYRGGARGGGSGLGLAVVRGFVDANGGTVRVESLPGQGATFVVELPLTRTVVPA